MKIIKQGTKKKWKIEVECKGNLHGNEYKCCGSILEIEENDIQIYRTSSNDSGIFYFECCSCHIKTIIDPNLIPLTKQKELQNQGWGDRD